MKRVAVVLSGCGVYDGSEIHEAVLALLFLDKAGAEVQCFAPDKPQRDVINHLKGEPAEGEQRNVLVESARLARGNIKPLSELDIEALDGVVFPGGFGAAKNLSAFAVDGPAGEVDPEVARVIQTAVRQGKVVGVICIAPAVVAKALEGTGRSPKLTIGTDADTAGALEAMGALHCPASVSEVCVDEANRLVSTPAYMLGQSISEVATGIEAFVQKVMELA
jgi:enhancing lycopene biosynthesis protein 2